MAKKGELKSMIKKVLKKLIAAVLTTVTVVTTIPAVADIKSNKFDIQTLNYENNKVNENDIAYENVTIADYDAVSWNLLNLYNMWFKITPYANLGLYLQPHLDDGKDVDVWDVGSTYSQWTFEPHEDVDGDYFYIKNINTGKYLWFDSLRNGAKVNVETTNPGWNNRWQLVTNQTTFTFSIRPYADTKYCLDIGGRDASNPEIGDSVHIWEYLGGQNQEWCIDSNAREDYNDFFRYGVGFKAAGLQAFNQGTEGSLYGMAKDIIDYHNYKSSFGFNNNIRMNWNLFNPDITAKVANINVFREVNENYKFPLKIDNDGYRYFDSHNMYVIKNDSSKKFELYDGSYDLTCHYSQKEWGTSVKTGQFAPYNTPQNTNFQYGFAMTMQLEFYMAQDGKVHIFDENGHETTQSMIFEFSGDDDMWIYIDMDLCLDVGGTHAEKPGTINFDKSTNGGKCVAKTFEGDGSAGWQKEFDLSTGTHTLTMFYIERAQDQSNLKVRYNLISRNNLKIDPNGGTYRGKSDVYEAGDFLSNETVKLNVPTRAGYTFKGWDIQGSGRLSSNNKKYYMGYNDTTLVAQWEPNQYNLNFDYNKPQDAASDIIGNNIVSKKVVYTEAVGELPHPNLTGYTFAGWKDIDGNIYTKDTIYNILGDTTLYAYWNAEVNNEWNASLSKINDDSINALNLTNDDRAINWKFGLGYGKVMHNTLTFTEFGDMRGFLNVKISNVVPTKIKYEFSDTRINSIQLSNCEHVDIGIENGKAVYLHNVSSAASNGYLHRICFNIPDYEAEFDVNKEKEYSAYIDISVSYNRNNTGETTETRRVYYNLEELDVSKVHSRIRRQPGQANN